MNTRNIVYFEGKNVRSETVPKDGFTTTTNGKSTLNKTSVQDRRSTLILGEMRTFARIDTDYNNVVTNPYSDAPWHRHG